MSIILNSPLVSVDWLLNHLDYKKIIILDCTIPKITENKGDFISKEKQQIKNAVFFDIKNVFSKTNSAFPNTVLPPKDFEKKAQKLGINKDSILICYDDLGVYSSPRVWWNFKLMGFTNIAVLDGGFLKWKENDYPIEKSKNYQCKKGDFKVNYQPQNIKFTNDVLVVLNNEKTIIIDARSKGRFYAEIPEPRKGVKSGHIPKSISLPYSEIQENELLKSKEKLKLIFNQLTQNKEEIIFSCGTGVTATILALAAEIAEVKNYAVYDGSWTEWGLTHNLPIEI